MTQRYEKEIEEILQKAGEPPSRQQTSGPAEPPPEPGPRRSSRRGAIRRIATSYKYLLLAGVGALIASIFLGGLPLFLIGAGLLAAGYVAYYRALRSGGRGNTGNDGGGREPKVWRGRTIDPDDDPHFTKDRWGRGRR